MNCKPGDLAVIVRSRAGNEGKIVRCLRLATEDEGRSLHRHGKCAIWVIDQVIKGTIFPVALAYDDWLRPIRPGDITDEEVRDLYAPKVPETA